MESTAISYLAICTRDMDKSLAFYRDRLGLHVLFDGQTRPMEGERPHHDRQVRQSRRRVSLSVAKHPKPTLTLTRHPGEEIAGKPLKLDQTGMTPFAFTVPNAAVLLDELLAQGVQLAGPREAFIDAEGRTRTFYVYDPDGMIIPFDSGLDEG